MTVTIYYFEFSLVISFFISQIISLSLSFTTIHQLVSNQYTLLILVLFLLSFSAVVLKYKVVVTELCLEQGKLSFIMADFFFKTLGPTPLAFLIILTFGRY